MIKNVIFDIGNVLVLFDETNHATKLFGHEKASKLLEGLWSKGIGDDFDRGVLLEEEVIEKYVLLLPDLKNEILTYIETLGECVYKFSYAIPWIKELKKLGYKVYFLSNYSKWFMRSNPLVLDFIPYMDGGVFSCDCHFLKPEKEIFDYLISKYNLNPSDSYFIDDMKRNIDGAKKQGFHAYKFTSYEKDYEAIMREIKSL